MSLVLDGRAVETPGLDTLSFLDDRRVPRATDFNDRAEPIAAVLLHTVKGKSGPLLPGGRASTRDLTYAAYQANTDRDVSWDYTVDTDGSIAVSNDPVRRYTWHAGVGKVNRQSVGIEAVQYDDGAQYEVQIAAEVQLVELLCDRLHLPRRTPVTADGRPFGGLLDEHLFHGVYGHRNLWKLKDGRRVTMKPLGDPDDHVFRALLRAGFQGVLVDARGRLTEPAAPPPPPPWVDLSRELTDTGDRDTTPEQFVRECIAGLVALGFDRARAIEVTAHCATECSWGRRAVGRNRGGVKLKERDDAAYRRTSGGRGLAWWRARGHVAAGDDAWVYYRAFDTDEAFWRFWAGRYVPQATPAGERYAATGAALWGDTPERWFPELLLAGYRGPVREREAEDFDARGELEEHPSVKEHRAVVARVRALVRAG